jgi:hypothetical protein
VEFLVSGATDFAAGRETSRSSNLERMKRPWDAVAWWEIRRIPFNLFMLVIGLASGFLFALAGSHVFRSDVDLGKPFLSMIFYALAANLFYTLGWITELLWAWGDTAQTEKVRSKVFCVGLIFSAGLTLLPAIALSLIWAIRSFR